MHPLNQAIYSVSKTISSKVSNIVIAFTSVQKISAIAFLTKTCPERRLTCGARVMQPQ
jgi:hypothetical protein